MKRLLLVLLMVVMPFQVSWAAVSAYCQDEKIAVSIDVSQHPGHHEHAEKVASQADKSNDQQKSIANADECSFCHLSCVKFFTVASSLATPVRDEARFPRSAPHIYISPTISPAEDPDWTLAA